MFKNCIKMCLLRKIPKSTIQQFLYAKHIYKYICFYPTSTPHYCVEKRKLQSFSLNFKLYFLPYKQLNKEVGKTEKIFLQQSFSLVAVGIALFSIFGLLMYNLGKNPTDKTGKKLIDEYSNLPGYHQYLYRTMGFINYYSRLVAEPSRRQKLLPDPMQSPYHQPVYTLIIEMTDVLVHLEYSYEIGWRFIKRPGLERFLENLEGIYEIVIFTSEQDMTVFPIIMALDSKNIISHALFQDAMHFVGGYFVKDLTNLNRDLSKVIVLDWNKDALKLHPENLFKLARWTGDENDTTLCDLAAFLKSIAQSSVEDVRPVLSYYKQFVDPLSEFREKQIKSVEDAEEIVEQLSENGNYFERFITFFKSMFR